MNKLSKLFLGTIVLGIFLFGFVAAVEPFGAEIAMGNSNRSDPAFYAPDLANDKGVHEALAGNVTELTIEGVSVTQSWQGYYGNVSGMIILADSEEHRMYDWSLADPRGEVYASPSDSISWLQVDCYPEGNLDDYLGAAYGIEWDNATFPAVDRVSNTFSSDGSHENGDSLVHDTFYTANIEFSQGVCASTHLFTRDNILDETAVVSGIFQEVLLYDTERASELVDGHVIFVSILDQERPTGFNGEEETYNFQMLVLEDGHGTDIDTTTYYFWVELE